MANFFLFLFWFHVLINKSDQLEQKFEVGKNSSTILNANELTKNQILKRSSFYPLKLPSLRLPCKRFSCRFGNCENLIVNNVLNYTCHCVRGVAGPSCDTLDLERLPCSSNPCYGGARCYNYMDDYYCECPVGRGGKNCNTSASNALDPCKNNPCGASGICFTATNGYWCFCNDGKHGFSCKNLEDEPVFTPLCARDSCLNEGRCLPMNNSIICACKPNYYGPKCEFRLNTLKIEKCITNVCQNNGNCTIKAGKVNCDCSPLYTGKYCESSIFTPCGTGSCHNINGVCIMAKCYCFEGFTGIRCDLKEKPT